MNKLILYKYSNNESHYHGQLKQKLSNAVNVRKLSNESLSSYHKDLIKSIQEIIANRFIFNMMNIEICQYDPFAIDPKAWLKLS